MDLLTPPRWIRSALRRRGPGAGAGALAVCLLLSWGADRAGAQLISPGRLSRAHADLEGITKCTQCHALRSRGISPELCLDCHEPLARRIEGGEGFHGHLAEKDCASCHREHFGADFDLMRLDTTTFDHRLTGWPLDGKHTSSSCHDCHTPRNVVDADVRTFKAAHASLDRTFLGLSGSCRTCHESDSPHEGQFRGRACGTCHTTIAWKGARRFDHDSASFKLVGAHRRARCDQCHATTPQGAGRPARVRYRGVSTSCAACHGDDSPHGEQFAGRSCGACHDPVGWKRAALFDHAAARFPLTGMHRDVRCVQCHASVPGARGRPMVRYHGTPFASCNDCHDDPHHGAMKQTCARCHTTGGWSVLDRAHVEGAFDHAGTGFPLKGRHAAIDCRSCHDAHVIQGLKGMHITFEPGTERHTYPVPTATDCAGCHVDVHGGAFAARPDSGACQACHRESAWVPGTFDLMRHNRETRFRLEGAHEVVPCASCHRRESESGPPTFRLGTVTCAGCHEDTNPHGDQFAGRSCDECHTVAGFRIPRFDHSKTRFPLVGAHRTAPCTACHLTERTRQGRAMVRYRPLGRECSDCHGGGA